VLLGLGWGVVIWAWAAGAATRVATTATGAISDIKTFFMRKKGNLKGQK
jgi:hypothetical protein